MLAVLYVSHGSRVEQARQEALAFIEAAKKQVEVSLQETCFLELAEPDIGEGIAKLAEQGATKIAVVPVLLLSAGHYYKDIPEEVNEARKNYPDITFMYGQPIGVQDRLVDILVERLEETQADRHPDADILLVGRGSKNPATKTAMEDIARRLKLKTGVSRVDVCYLAACSPSFEKGLATALEKDAPQTFVIPYLWFTGILMQSMQKEIDQLDSGDHQFVLCQYLGQHSALVTALADRVKETVAEGIEFGSTEEFAFNHSIPVTE